MSSNFAQFEHDGWERVAHKYETAWSGLTRGFIPPLLDAAKITPDQDVLDVACGPGYVAEAIKARGARPIGLDFSAQMVRIATERNPTINFLNGDAQALRFPDNSFNTVLMNFGLLHLPDPQAAFRESLRVLHPGGCYGFTVWADPELSVGAKIVDDAITAHANLDVEVPKGPDYFCYGHPNECSDALELAGFDRSSVRFVTVTSEWEIPTPNFFFECERNAGVRTAAMLACQTEQTLRDIENQMAQAVIEHARGESYVIPFAAHIVTVRKPS